ncbi:MAG TPA: PilZ domain-containing protein [Candidatus Methylomirabilis sp.]|nr:PilZ domain-containing protein [Candidatus Methylomirabilis sp.]
MGDSLLHATHIVWKRPVRKIAPRYGYNIQRQGARVCLRSGALATLQFWEVTLLNLSRSGVLLEHFHQVRVGGQYQLTFPVEDRRITVTARVARSSVSHFTGVDGGEKRPCIVPGWNSRGSRRTWPSRSRASSIACGRQI